MPKRLYVGNLPFSATQDQVRAEFAKFGDISDCHLPTDRETGQARGFGFVTFSNPAEADAAIQGLNGRDFGGRALRVNEAEERRGGPPGGGGGGNFRGGGGGRPQGGGGRGGGGGRDRGRRNDRYDQD